MRRRLLLFGAAACLAGLPGKLRAQSRVRPFRLAYVHVQTAAVARRIRDTFLEALHDLGYPPDRLVLESRYADGTRAVGRR
jgi:hypothetical protein